MKADYQKACDSLVYYMKLKKDLNKDFFNLHKKKEKLLYVMELLKIPSLLISKSETNKSLLISEGS